MTATSAAPAALDRLDDGLPLPDTDRHMLRIFEEHCQERAFRWPEPAGPCQICGEETDGPECVGCHIKYERWLDRARDL